MDRWTSPSSRQSQVLATSWTFPMTRRPLSGQIRQRWILKYFFRRLIMHHKFRLSLFSSRNAYHYNVNTRGSGPPCKTNFVCGTQCCSRTRLEDDPKIPKWSSTDYHVKDSSRNPTCVCIQLYPDMLTIMRRTARPTFLGPGG